MNDYKLKKDTVSYQLLLHTRIKVKFLNTNQEIRNRQIDDATFDYLHIHKTHVFI